MHPDPFALIAENETLQAENSALALRIYHANIVHAALAQTVQSGYTASYPLQEFIPSEERTEDSERLVRIEHHLLDLARERNVKFTVRKTTRLVATGFILGAAACFLALAIAAAVHGGNKSNPTIPSNPTTSTFNK